MARPKKFKENMTMVSLQVSTTQLGRLDELGKKLKVSRCDLIRLGIDRLDKNNEKALCGLCNNTFGIETALCPHCELERFDDMGVKDKNLLIILDIMRLSRERQALALIQDIEAHCGVTDKKAEEYLKLLIHIGKLKQNNAYILTPEHYEELTKNNKPLPGSPEWFREKNTREIADFNKRYEEKKKQKKDSEEELTEEEKILLGE